MAAPTPSELVHYTTRDFAEEVIREIDAVGVAAEVWDGAYGPGFYALDLSPDAGSRDELRWECFGDARSDHPMDGALVLEASLAVPPFAHQERHIWLMPGSAGTPISIGHMVTEVGIWDGASWEMHAI